MNRQGFTLVSVLWLLVVISAATAGSLELARLEARAAANRILLRRAAWARAACAAIAGARISEGQPLTGLDSVDLGGRLWCTVHEEPAHGRLDLNRTSGLALRQLLQSDSLASAFEDWIDRDTLDRAGWSENEWYRARRRRLPRNGTLESLDELLLIRGFDSAVVAGLRPRAVVWPAGLAPDCPEPRCDGSAVLLVVEGRFGGSRPTAPGRVLLRRAGGRAAVLAQEMP